MQIQYIPLIILHRNVKIFCCPGLKVNTRFESELLKCPQYNSSIVHTYNLNENTSCWKMKIRYIQKYIYMYFQFISYSDLNSARRAQGFSTGIQFQELNSFPLTLKRRDLIGLL